MPERNGAAVHVSDGGTPTALTHPPPDVDPRVESAGPVWDSTCAGQLPVPVPVPDR